MRYVSYNWPQIHLKTPCHVPFLHASLLSAIIGPFNPEDGK